MAAQAQELSITTFTRSAQVRPAMVQLKDYTFKNPKWAAEFSEQARELQNQRPDYEHFDFPGRFKDEQHGKDFTRYRLEALRNDANKGQGESNEFTLQPGQLFSLSAHPRDDLNHAWQIVSIQHTGKQMQALEQESGDQGTVLFNQFSFIPPTQTWRPTPLPKPVTDGPQIAMVVGPRAKKFTATSMAASGCNSSGTAMVKVTIKVHVGSALPSRGLAKAGACWRSRVSARKWW